MAVVWSVEWDLVVFLLIAAITIIAALAVIWSKEIVRSVMWLSLVFVGVGATYILLGSEYLGIIQILIYVGAVSVLMLFGIMLTKRRLLGGDRYE
ncbi:MAG TPA: NADH-quinone oxidoreductase subunit J [Methanomassiliicoccaceae archaeon]|jgi:NADH:ubiquinone oxidoreductase subunit 6 (subunit J)|nr:short chain dehydrogenase [Euryarchaeota archaeon]HOB37722.1 NADH-quinone oxidoreductase subunit J [Methanomassiliicoccaceae archaeon]HOL06989.1 NADH-quinone oxidoreductase subunit J [Methanomassiliicoccaceae archaeon]HOQ25296.1 NADH-quinone oxidoreductase subunit J [Methanomassiliicoccaceae archaeon]HPP44409.1 NADH-quinone oxidoreductase subunit J [Methanomassiliicoccaceae archaeon]